MTHFWNFSKSKGHDSAENYSTWPKFKLSLCILLTHLYTEFHLKMSVCNGDNERKLKINGIFLGPRGITLAENYLTGPKFEFNLRILVTHLYTKFQFKMSICNGDKAIPSFFLVKRQVWLLKPTYLSGKNKRANEQLNIINLYICTVDHDFISVNVSTMLYYMLSEQDMRC